jgi:tetraacyldisaccharide-1-P 4'-kinase
LVPLGACRSLRQDHIGAEFLQWKPFLVSSVHNSLGDEPRGAVIVLCGIGNPLRFAANLEEYGLKLKEKVFLRDHSTQVASRLESLLLGCEDPIVITEKDAVRIPQAKLEHPRVFIARQAWLEEAKKVS